MRAQFVMSEMWVGLRRNLTLTIATIVTVAVSLTIGGAGLLMRAQANFMEEFWHGKIEVSIYLENNVTAAQRESLQADLAKMPEVKSLVYESKEDAFARFNEQFKDSPSIRENVVADDLPESFQVKLVNPDRYDILVSAFADRPGVQEVNNPRQVLDKLFRTLGRFQLVALLFATLALLAGALLITNTVRVAAFSRRRETGIMRLVGASNLYIQLPFLLEGVLAGVIGAALASLLLALGFEFVVNRMMREEFLFTSYIGWDAVIGVIPRLVLLGVALAGLSSFLTLRKYLRV